MISFFEFFLLISPIFLFWALVIVIHMPASNTKPIFIQKHYCKDCIYDKEGDLCSYVLRRTTNYAIGETIVHYKNKLIRNSDGECTSWKPKEQLI